jgi:uncharacterized membrane protein YfcA
VTDPVAYLLLLLAVGAAAGTLAGLLGVGGGLLVVPALAFTFAARGVPDAVVMQTAVGTSLATIVVTSLASVRAHHRAGAVAWDRVRHLAPPIAVGAGLGALRAVVGLFEVLVAVRIGLGARERPVGAPGPRAASPLWGVPIGALSALVGIGGGTLTVPYLMGLGEKVHRAVGTGAACGLPIAVAGGLGFALLGRHVAGVPAPRLGYIHLPAFAAIATASALFAPLGVRLAHRLPAARLQRVFAAFLLLVGARMLVV